MVIGVAGGFCAGKDAVVRFLERAGFPSIDVDAVGHRVLDERADAVRQAFGPSVMGPDGAVDRAALGKLVFRGRAALRRLEGILHPRMREIVRSEALGTHSGHCVVNAAVLFRMRLDDTCDAVICVRAPLLARLARARRRDGGRVLSSLRRMWSQRGICLKPRDSRVDTHTVRNAGSLEDLERACDALLDRLRAAQGDPGGRQKRP